MIYFYCNHYKIVSVTIRQKEGAFMDSAKMLTMHNIRPSVIRVMIYDFVKNTKSHPTADEIYRCLHPKAPTLSKTTVYNTVKLFASGGLLKVLSIDGHQLRYDADTCHHGHFRCEECDRIFDFTIEKDCEAGLEGFDVTQREIFYSGRCGQCK